MDQGVSESDSEEGNLESFGFQPPPENKVAVEVTILCRKKLYGPLVVYLDGDGEENSPNASLGSLRAILKLLNGGVEADLMPGVQFVIPSLLDSHVVVVLPTEATRPVGQSPFFQQVVCAVEVQGSATMEEIQVALRTNFQHPSLLKVDGLYGYDLKRLDNVPNAFCPGSVFIGIVPTGESSIPRQNDFDVVEAQTNSRMTSTFDRRTLTLPSSLLPMETGPGWLHRDVGVPTMSPFHEVDYLPPFKHDNTQQDATQDGDEQLFSPPNISLVPVNMTGPHQLQGNGDYPTTDVRASGNVDDGGVEHKLSLEVEGGPRSRPSGEQEVPVETPAFLTQAVRPDSVVDRRNDSIQPVFGVHQAITPQGAGKEYVVPNMRLPVLGGEPSHLVLPHGCNLKDGSPGPEQLCDLSEDRAESSVIRQKTGDSDLESGHVEVCALEHVSNGYCSLCRLQNRDECRIVRLHLSLIEEQSRHLSSVRKGACPEEEKVKETIRAHCRWCRDLQCKVPHHFAGCANPGTQSLSESFGQSPMTASGNGSKEICIPPPASFASVLPNARRYIFQGVMVFEGSESQREHVDCQQIEFPDDLVGKDHGDVIYCRKDISILEGCFKHLPSIREIRQQDILGKGGNGTVFQHPYNGTIYAFKLTTYRRKEHEIWIKLQSENVTSLLAVLVYSPAGFTGTPKCLQVMPLMSGTLASHLKKIGGSLANALNSEPCPWAVFQCTWLVLRQVLAGLGYLADNRVYYRDLKASNVLVHRRCTCDSVFRCDHHNNWSLQSCMKLGDFDSAVSFKTAHTEAYTAYRDYPMVTKSPGTCAKELGTVGNRAPESFQT